MAETQGIRIYTVGHSNYTFGAFIELLRRHAISILADIRSSPFSRYCPQFNKDVLRQALANERIDYVFLGKELGARPSNRACYEGGRVSFTKLAEDPAFRTGLQRLTEAARHPVAIMCAEKDPLECHRAILVSRELSRLGVDVRHILDDGRLESHADTEKRLVRKLKIEPTLFEPSEATDLIEKAYEMQARRIGHRDDEAQLPVSDRTG